VFSYFLGVTDIVFICLTRGGSSCGGHWGTRGHRGTGRGENEDVRWGNVCGYDGSFIAMHHLWPSETAQAVNFLSIPHRAQLDKKSQPTRRCRPWSTTSSPINSSLLTIPKVCLCCVNWNQNQTKWDVITNCTGKHIKVKVSFAILFSLHREKQEFRHFIFCGDQRRGNDF